MYKPQLDGTSISMVCKTIMQDNEDSLVGYLRAYFTHHINNKIATIEGNVTYVRKKIDDLDNVKTARPEDEKRLMAIKRGVNEALKPIEETLEKIHAIRDEINAFLDKIDRLR